MAAKKPIAINACVNFFMVIDFLWLIPVHVLWVMSPCMIRFRLLKPRQLTFVPLPLQPH
jgi:hypothetical protein